jgi:hypothetical protein
MNEETENNCPVCQLPFDLNAIRRSTIYTCMRCFSKYAIHRVCSKHGLGFIDSTEYAEIIATAERKDVADVPDYGGWVCHGCVREGFPNRNDVGSEIRLELIESGMSAYMD